MAYIHAFIGTKEAPDGASDTDSTSLPSDSERGWLHSSGDEEHAVTSLRAALRNKGNQLIQEAQAVEKVEPVSNLRESLRSKGDRLISQVVLNPCVAPAEAVLWMPLHLQQPPAGRPLQRPVGIAHKPSPAASEVPQPSRLGGRSRRHLDVFGQVIAEEQAQPVCDARPDASSHLAETLVLMQERLLRARFAAAMAASTPTSTPVAAPPGLEFLGRPQEAALGAPRPAAGLQGVAPLLQERLLHEKFAASRADSTVAPPPGLRFDPQLPMKKRVPQFLAGTPQRCPR